MMSDERTPCQDARDEIWTEGKATIRVVDKGGHYFVGEFASGDPYDALALIRRVEALTKEKAVRLFVEHGEKAEKLIELYANFGARPIGYLMEVPKSLES